MATTIFYSNLRLIAEFLSSSRSKITIKTSYTDIASYKTNSEKDFDVCEAFFIASGKQLKKKKTTKNSKRLC